MNTQHLQSRRKFVSASIGAAGFVSIAGCTDDNTGGTNGNSSGGTNEDTDDTDGNGGSSYDAEQVREDAEYIEYSELLRNIDSYVGEAIHYPWGEVVQALNESNQYRVYVGEHPGFDSRDILVEYSGDERFVEDDQIKLWGVVEGTFTYETVGGDERTIPEITLVDYEVFETVQDRDLNVGETYETPQGISATVLDIELQDTYQYENFEGETADAEPEDSGNQWCFIVFTSTNNTGSTEYIPFEDDVSIISNGSQFDSYLPFDDPINRSEDKYEGGEVQDGISRTGWILYQIPDDLSVGDIEAVWSDSSSYVEWNISWSV